ncbi:286_t:CDS:2, partial [Paraglomus occultum]
MAIINERPASVMQKIGEKLQQSLRPPARDVRCEGERDEHGMNANTESPDESSAKTIWALLAIVRMLIESGKIQRVVTCSDIQHAAFKGTMLTEKEKMPHILTRAPLAALANTIATITGCPSLVRSLSITSQQDLRSLQLTAAGAYDTFHGQWDIPINDASWITNSYDAGKNKAITFGAFFDMSRVEALMDSHGLQFAWR